MQTISILLKNYKKLHVPDSEVRRVAAACMKDIVGIDIELSLISVRGGEVIFRVSPLVRNEIYMHAPEVRECILARQNGYQIKRIV